jgi:hypothetical protein
VLDALRTPPTWKPDGRGGFEAIVGPLRFVAFPCDEAGKPDWSWWIDPSAFDLADMRLRNNTLDVLVEGYSRTADTAKRAALNHAPEAQKRLVELILRGRWVPGQGLALAREARMILHYRGKLATPILERESR